MLKVVLGLSVAVILYKDEVMLQHMIDEIASDDPFETGSMLGADLLKVIGIQVSGIALLSHIEICVECTRQP